MLAAYAPAQIDGLFSLEALIALVALTAMEIVLGIDNIVFIAIKTGRLPEAQRPAARRLGLLLALGMRILLLLAITWVVSSAEYPLFQISEILPQVLAEQVSEDHELDRFTLRDLILLAGGLFLLYTSVREIHHKIEGGDEEGIDEGTAPTMRGVLFQIAVMDLIFSLDSVITAVGMARQIWVMVTAVVIAVGVMIAFANQISEFVQRHPTVKMLALSFLMLIGVVLVSEAVGTPLSKGYVYFAMAFSLLVEFFNLRMKMKRLRPGPGAGEVGTVTHTS